VLEEFKKHKTFFRFEFEKADQLKEQFLPESPSKDIRLTWYTRLEELLRDDYELKKAGKDLPTTVFLMNEFFDALPVTVLEYTPEGWREKVLRLSADPEYPFPYPDCPSRSPTPPTPPTPNWCPKSPVPSWATASRSVPRAW
jgi:hypothetical protein